MHQLWQNTKNSKFPALYQILGRVIKIHNFFQSTEEDIPFTMKQKWGTRTGVLQTAWNIKKLGQGAGSYDPVSLKKYDWITTINHNPQA